MKITTRNEYILMKYIFLNSLVFLALDLIQGFMTRQFGHYDHILYQRFLVSQKWGVQKIAWNSDVNTFLATQEI